MKIRFIEDCTVYPGDTETDVRVGAELDIEDATYARLLIAKGHAVAAEKALALKKEKP